MDGYSDVKLNSGFSFMWFAVITLQGKMHLLTQEERTLTKALRFYPFPLFILWHDRIKYCIVKIYI